MTFVSSMRAISPRAPTALRTREDVTRNRGASGPPDGRADGEPAPGASAQPSRGGAARARDVASRRAVLRISSSLRHTDGARLLLAHPNSLSMQRYPKQIALRVRLGKDVRRRVGSGRQRTMLDDSDAR